MRAANGKAAGAQQIRQNAEALERGESLPFCLRRGILIGVTLPAKISPNASLPQSSLSEKLLP
jgi:hypothetical protein